MEIKAILAKPYTEEKRLAFIVENNHKMGFEIKETDIALEAWGYTEEEEQAQKEEQFNREFFNTSLGYIRRQVRMKDGSTRDFLTDILPLLEVGVPILTYSKELKQSKVQVTETFLDECKQQLLVDFYGGK